MIIIYEKPFNNHQFEIGQVREFQGVYVEKPKPMLILDDTYYPNSYDNHALLVGYGKFGATSTIREIEKIWGDLAYKQIRIRGTLLYGDGKLVIELTDGVSSISEVSERSHDKDIPSQKTEVIRHGEIIDPKCWFGAMKPGEGKVHKSCAIRCISGGIPPILRVKQQEEYVYYILQSEGDEDINQSILSFVGEPVAVQGQEYTHNGWSVLITSADKIEYK
ncbi:MAG: hypothetical protein ACPH7I_04420 [Flavobacteriaceae bacterium]